MISQAPALAYKNIDLDNIQIDMSQQGREPLGVEGSNKAQG
jgi:hypothetical protein